MRPYSGRQIKYMDYYSYLCAEIMKNLLYIIFLGLILTAFHSARTTTPAETSCCQEQEHIENIYDGPGFIAYNAIKGTSEKIQTPDRQVYLYRNSYNGPAGYSQATSKRQSGSGFKWSLVHSINHSLLNRYYFLTHNMMILDRGMSSNSERIHLLRVLIV